jgi:hypothetical protein
MNTRPRLVLAATTVALASACAVDIADFTTTGDGAPTRLIDAMTDHDDAGGGTHRDGGAHHDAADATSEATPDARRDALLDVHEQPDAHTVSDASADACIPGVQANFGSCGMCGTLQKTCTPADVWGDPECMNQGACAPTTTQTMPCGNCGQATQVCQDDCTWGPLGACNNQGVCTPGDIMCAHFSGGGALIFSCVGAATCGATYAACGACLAEGAFWDWYPCDSTCQWNDSCNPSCTSTNPLCSY